MAGYSRGADRPRHEATVTVTRQPVGNRRRDLASSVRQSVFGNPLNPMARRLVLGHCGWRRTDGGPRPVTETWRQRGGCWLAPPRVRGPRGLGSIPTSLDCYGSGGLDGVSRVRALCGPRDAEGCSPPRPDRGGGSPRAYSAPPEPGPMYGELASAVGRPRAQRALIDAGKVESPSAVG